MKRVYLLVTINVLCLGLFGQTFDWAKAEGKYAYDYGYGASMDNSGNVYVAGKYEQDQADFSGTKVGCEGNHDGFLVKYAPNGDLQWIRTMGGPDGDYVQAVYCDKTNYVYVAGEIESAGGNTLIKFSGSTTTLNCVGDNDIFLAKYDLSGNLIWAKSEGYWNSEKALGITSDKDDNVYICGYYSTSTRINGVTYTGKGGRDIFIAKYDKDGVFQWFRDAGSSKRDEAKGIACDSDGNVYICGMFHNNAQFDTQVLTTYKNTVYWDAFLAKYDTNGNLLWVKKGGGDIDDGGWAITIDNQNSIYMTGEFGAYAQFNGVPIVSTGAAETYVAKYNTSGDLQWIRRAGSDKVDRARGIGTDGTHIFITGQFGGTATFGGTAPITATDTSDIYIAALDNNGDFKWAVRVDGPPDAYEGLGYESGNGITGFASGSDGSVYATGGLLDGGVFGNHTVIRSGSRTDAFVTKISWDTGMPSIPVAVSNYSSLRDVKVFPNPGTGKFYFHADVASGDVSVRVYNCVGSLVKTCLLMADQVQAIDLNTETKGIYLAEFIQDDIVISRQKLILEK